MAKTEWPWQNNEVMVKSFSESHTHAWHAPCMHTPMHPLRARTHNQLSDMEATLPWKQLRGSPSLTGYLIPPACCPVGRKLQQWLHHLQSCDSSFSESDVHCCRRPTRDEPRSAPLSAVSLPVVNRLPLGQCQSRIYLWTKGFEHMPA